MADYTSEQIISINKKNLDNYSKLKTSQFTTILDIKHIGEINNTFEAERKSAENPGSELTSDNGILLTVYSDEYIRRQSKQYIQYQQGKTITIFATAVMNADANYYATHSRVGFYDEITGVYFQFDGNSDSGDPDASSDGTMKIMYFKNQETPTEIKQSMWNIDTVSLSGPSGVTADWTKVNTFVIEINWPVSIRLGIIAGGKVCYVHEINNSSSDTLMIESPNLPVKYELISSQIDARGKLKYYSTFVTADVDYKLGGTIRTLIAPSEVTINKIKERPILCLKTKSSSNVANDRVTIIPLLLELILSQASRVVYNIYVFKSPVDLPIVNRNGTAVAFSGISDTKTAYYLGTTTTEIVKSSDNLGTSILDTKETLYSGFFDYNLKFDFTEMLGKYNSYNFLSTDIQGKPDYLVITCQILSGIDSRTVLSRLVWNEIFHCDKVYAGDDR